jgi:hypothetical protein
MGESQQLRRRPVTEKPPTHLQLAICQMLPQGSFAVLRTTPHQSPVEGRMSPNGGRVSHTGLDSAATMTSEAGMSPLGTLFL